jgi:hypothetical protein
VKREGKEREVTRERKGRDGIRKENREAGRRIRKRQKEAYIVLKIGQGAIGECGKRK